MGVGVDDLCVVRAGELYLSFRRGQLLAARASVLQGSHLRRVAERREREDDERRMGQNGRRKKRGNKVIGGC